MRAVAVLGIPLLGLILLMPAAKAAPTLFDQLGGSPGVTTVVEHLVALVTTDARTKDDFDNINLDRLKRRLRDFLLPGCGRSVPLHRPFDGRHP